MPRLARSSLVLLGLLLGVPILLPAQPVIRVIDGLRMNPVPAVPAPERVSAPTRMAGFLNGTLWETVAAQVGLDPLLLYGVALQETRHGTSSKASAPWPFTLRGPDGPQFHASKAQAEQALRQLTARHRPLAIDVGLMQVNLRWHGDKVADPTDLLDAHTNLIVAADILAKAIASAPGDLELGVGHYHHWHNEARARAYGRRVLQMVKALSTL